jgi:hypothetical protein
VVALVPDSEATRDIDLLWTDSLRSLVERLGRPEWDRLATGIALSLRADIFEMNLPEDWQSRARRISDLCFGNLAVFTPAPEDLAVMKMFRFNAKDAQDIQRLAAVDFDRERFKGSFLAVLPYAIGSRGWHAQSFEMLWNRLWPEVALSAGELLADEDN